MGVGIRAIFTATGLKKEYHHDLGPGTNNQAEILAIKMGLEKIVKDRSKANVTVYSDSAYAIGCLTNSSWNPKVNKEIIASTKKLMVQFASVQILKVKGHSSHIGNDAADTLAKKATHKWRKSNES